MASKRLEASFLRREKKCLHLRSASYARMCVSHHRFCLLTTSSVKYGTDKSTLPNGVANFFYGPKTRNTNLRRHLHQVHSDEYDKVVLLNKWTYKLSTQTRDASTQSGDASTHNAHNKRDRQLPSFSPASFLEHLVRFIVADDQVSPDDVFFHALTIFSRFALSNALSFVNYVWFFARLSSTLTSLAGIR
jgi:hypothetical protein